MAYNLTNFTEKQQSTIRKERARGMSIVAIAKKRGCQQKTIAKVLAGTYTSRHQLTSNGQDLREEGPENQHRKLVKDLLLSHLDTIKRLVLEL